MESKMYRCQNLGCRNSFQWPVQLHRHQKKCSKQKPQTKYEKVEDQFRCSSCNKLFKHQSNISRHVKQCKIQSKSTPLETKELKCSLCPKVFRFKCRLDAHFKTHQKRSEREKHCPNCFRKFVRSDHFEKHVNTCNGAESLPNTSNEIDIPDLDLMNDSCFSLFSSSSSSEEDIDEVDFVVRNEENDVGNVNIGDSISNEELVDNDLVNADELEVNEPFKVNDTELNQLTVDESINVNNHLSEVNNELVDQLRNENSLEIYDGVEFDTIDVDGTETRREYHRDYYQKRKVRKSLDEIISSLSSPVKRSIGGSTLDDSLTTNTNDHFKATAINSVFNYLKSLVKKKNFSEFYRQFSLLFDDHLADQEFLKWASSKLGIRFSRFAPRFQIWSSRCFTDPRGRQRLPDEIVKSVYDAWVSNSVNSTDGRNGRSTINKKKSSVLQIYGDLKLLEHSDVNIDQHKNKRNQTVLSVNRRIATTTTREIQESLRGQGITISLGKITSLRPFFITPPTEKEMALCLCKLCLNAKFLLQALSSLAKQNNNELGMSVSNFFMSSTPCLKSDNGFFKWKCVSQKCKSCCNAQPLGSDYLNFQDVCRYTQFEVTKTPYTRVSRDGGEMNKVSTKTERVEFVGTCQDVFDKLVGMKKRYLIHKYQVYNDRYQWGRILGSLNEIGPIHHFDFSENIPQMFKFEPQSTHFNKKQFSLHCTVKHTSESNEYIYHFSNDMTHDFGFTSAVVNHLVELDNTSTIFRAKSDNCACQYKSKRVFNFWRNLAKKIDKVVLVYYGVSGHGKGLVDGMSAFGVKTPLRRAVVSEDFFYNDASDIFKFLKERYATEDGKKYFLLTEDIIEDQRRNDGELKIKDCRKQHMISYFPSGDVQAKLNMCSCENCVNGQFINCSDSKGKLISCSNDTDDSDSEECDDDVEFEKDDIADEDSEDYTIRGDAVLDAIEKGNTIALYSPESSFEPFYLCLVKDFGIAEEVLVDEFNHTILPGEKYIECQYFEKQTLKLGKSIVKYKLMNAIVYVYPSMVVAPVVNMKADYSLAIEEYIWLSDSI